MIIAAIIVLRPIIEQGGMSAPVSIAPPSPPHATANAEPIEALPAGAVVWLFIVDGPEQAIEATTRIGFLNQRQEALGEPPITAEIVWEREYLEQRNAITAYLWWFTSGGKGVREVRLTTR